MELVTCYFLKRHRMPTRTIDNFGLIEYFFFIYYASDIG